MQQKARIAWAKELLSWSSEDWDRAIFNDKSTFLIQNHAGSNYVRRRPQEAYSLQCILPTLEHPTSVAIWGSMTSHGIGRLDIYEGILNATKYPDVLETNCSQVFGVCLERQLDISR